MVDLIGKAAWARSVCRCAVRWAGDGARICGAEHRKSALGRPRLVDAGVRRAARRACA